MDRLDDVPGSLLSQEGAKERPVVGVIGWGVPPELVETHGATMVRFLPRMGRPTPLADALVGSSETEEMRALLEPVLDGSVKYCALLVITRAHEWIYYFLKEAIRTGVVDGRTIPALHIFDLVTSSESSLRPYNLDQMARLEAAITRELGQRGDSASWERAIRAGNERRALFRHIADLRKTGAVSGTDAIRMATASATRDMSSFVADANRWLEDRPSRAGFPRLLLLASEDDEDGAIHEAIEAAGSLIVAEDGEWGIRTAMPDLDPARERLELLLSSMLDAATGPSVSPREQRVGWAMNALARDDLDAVVFAISPRDQHFGWDYPQLRDRAAELGLPQLLLKADARANPAKTTEVVEEFLATLAKEPTA